MVTINRPYFSFLLQQKNSASYEATITIDQQAVSKLYNFLLHNQQGQAKPIGFSRGTAPLSYIEYIYQSSIIEEVREFFFNHGLRSFLEESLFNYRVITCSEPGLTTVAIEPKEQTQFMFSIVSTIPEIITEWKRLSLKPPHRKNYKDLDRQVESFLKEEEKTVEKIQDSIHYGDWICIDIAVLDNANTALLSDYSDRAWLRISDEEVDNDTCNLLLNHKVGDTFITTNRFLQEYLGETRDNNYNFLLTIVDRVPYIHFSIEQFKRHFRLKNAKEIHQKLIEIFSYRNDLSQRRETIEAVFKLLNDHYRIHLPTSVIEQQYEQVLESVRRNPDYYVYKSQKDFKQKVRALAIKQLKEMILIDHIGYQENIQLTNDDIIHYFNLLKRPRTKEFIYFGLPPTKVNGQESLIPADIVHKACFREKTLNHIIYNLTRH